MHTSTIIAFLEQYNFKSIPNDKLREVVQSIDDTTDLPLLISWINNNLTKNTHVMTFLYYFIPHLYKIKQLSDLPTFYDLLSIDNLYIFLLNKATTNKFPDDLRSILQSVFSSKLNAVLYPKKNKYNIFFNEAIRLYNLGIDNTIIQPIDEYIDIDTLESAKPYILLVSPYRDYYDFYIIKDKTYKLCNIILYADGITNVVTYRPYPENLKSIIQDKIIVCSGPSYQKLFDNLKNNIFPQKILRIRKYDPYDPYFIFYER